MTKEGGECPACASTNTIYSEIREQTICRDCGMIFEPFESSASFTSTEEDTTVLSSREVPLKRARKEPVKPAAKKPSRPQGPARRKPAKQATKPAPRKGQKNPARKSKPSKKPATKSHKPHKR